MRHNAHIVKLINWVGVLLLVISAGSVAGQNRRPGPPPKGCQKPENPFAHLINVDRLDSNRTPLILIHGIHGTARSESTTELSTDQKREEYWTVFLSGYWKNLNTKLKNKYELYIFKYCSDSRDISDIARVLGSEIETKLRGRSPVILAHSMGGLVAKNYMTSYTHSSGTWAGMKGGDVVLRLITLATPHHGTPGANDLSVLSPYFISSYWKRKFQFSQWIYWRFRNTEPKGDFPESHEPNRRELRWDNYDGSFDETAAEDDVNEWLVAINERFARFAPKVIAYAGFLKTNNKLGGTAVWPSEHIKAEIANNLLFKAFDGKFGISDGLVPIKSGLFCKPGSILVAPESQAICDLNVSVRRFEPGSNERVSDKNLPSQTLSIIRREVRGYDHKDMYTHPDVLNEVVKDLCKFVGGCDVSTGITPPPVLAAKIPTLLLFDVSGSMKDNDKIGQARVAGLDALGEMRDEGLSSSPVSVMSFAGECNAASVRRLMNFAPSLTQAEGVVRALRATDDATPLPQAKDAAISQMTSFLSANPAMKEGRIVLLSDGQSTCGDIRPPGVYSQRVDYRVRRSSNSTVKFFTIGFDVPAGSVAERDLQFLASETGGKYYNAADREQLIRSFRKHVRVYVPKSCASSTADLAAGLRAFSDTDFLAAAEAFKRYVAANPNDACGVYNLALAYEASDRYRKAALNYGKYLSLSSNARDRVRVERKIAEMHEEYAAYLAYMIDLISSDRTYLRNFYNSIFNRTSFDLANEFDGFVFEKGGFYSNLTEILEIDERWLANDAKDISSSLNRLASRRKLATFDSDAVSLLTTPIGYIEEMLERLSQYRAEKVR